jgi:hypothetical protein
MCSLQRWDSPCGFLSSTHSFGTSSETKQASAMVKWGDPSGVGAQNVIKTTMAHLYVEQKWDLEVVTKMFKDMCLDTFTSSRSKQSVQKVSFPKPVMHGVSHPKIWIWRAFETINRNHKFKWKVCCIHVVLHYFCIDVCFSFLSRLEFIWKSFKSKSRKLLKH